MPMTEQTQSHWRKIMLHYAVVFFVIAIIAAALGFTGIEAGAAEIAKILFFVFMVFFILALIGGTFHWPPA
jgi:uncharacterized membrane protein YtjA (UPF0391 family)